MATNEEETCCSRLRPMNTSDGTISETGGSRFADDMRKVKNNDDRGWNGIRNRSRRELLCHRHMEGT